MKEIIETLIDYGEEEEEEGEKSKEAKLMPIDVTELIKGVGSPFYPAIKETIEEPIFKVKDEIFKTIEGEGFRDVRKVVAKEKRSKKAFLRSLVSKGVPPEKAATIVALLDAQNFFAPLKADKGSQNEG